MKKKAWYTILLTLLLTAVVFLTGCSGAPQDAEDTEDSQTIEETGEQNSGDADAETEDTYEDLGVPVPQLPHPILGDAEEAANSRHADGTFTITKGGLVFHIPDYFGELESGKQGDDNLNAKVTTYYAATGDNLSMLQISAFDASESKLSDYDMVHGYQAIFEMETNTLEAEEDVGTVTWGEATLFRLPNGLVAVAGPHTFPAYGRDLTAVLVAINNPQGETLMLVKLTQAVGAEYDYFSDFEKMVLDIEVSE